MDATILRLRALAHPTRLSMVERLATTPEICACDLGEAFKVSQPTISQHLRILRDAGLVRTRRQGTSICYALEPGAIAELAELLNLLSSDVSPRRQRRPSRQRAYASSSSGTRRSTTSELARR